jgi:alkanesulfonate monooxygenase SsuD/methylene tetrahydromethanopterin reductase-like flavin-dependent oxidoreductase (luciferase family)
MDTIELAARHGFIPLFGRGNDSADEVSRWSDAYLAAAQAAGRQPSRSDFHVSHIVYVGESDAEARNDVRDSLSHLVADRDPVYLARHVPPGKTIADLTFDYMVDAGHYWVGSPDTVRRRLEDYYEQSGGFGVLLMFAALPLTAPENIARSLRLFMEEVAPAVAALDPDAAPAAVGEDRKLAEVERR